MPDLPIDLAHVESPATEAELAARIADLVRQGLAVYPMGGGCAWDFGTPPSKPGVAISLAKLCRVIDYPARDMTITIEAGMTLSALDELLRAEGQRLPVDVPHPERATVGGALSVNAFGPRRLGCGTFRDWLIGISYITDRGTIAKAGGRVVKNVAGYDMGKLLIGSLGSLGIITQATFKLQPHPAASALVVVPVVDLGAALDIVHQSQTRPQAVEYLNAAAALAVGLNRHDCVIALFEDHPESVAWQASRWCDELKTPGSLLEPSVVSELLQKLIASPAVDGCELSLLASVRPAKVASFVANLGRPDLLVHAHAMSGQVRLGAVDAADSAKIQATAMAGVGDGNVVVLQDNSHAIDSIWGRSPPAIALMKRIKAALDPQGLLNSGRTAWG